MKFFRNYKRILLALLGIIIILVAGGGLYIGYLLNSTQKIEDLDMEDMTNPNLSEETQEIMKGYWTIALFGVDARDGELGKDTLSDVEIICNIDRATGEIRLVSVYRDTLLKVSKKGKYDKINSAYFQGGPTQAVWALTENLDMSFDDCVAFNWKAVADAINILGGIDIEITKDEFKLINGFITETVESTGVYSTQLTHAGMNHLDGVQAVAYARLRKLDTDFKRTERQRTVIEKALEKAKKADFATLNNILVTVLPQMKSTIDINDLIPMAKNITRYHIGTSKGFPFQLSDKIIDRKDVVIPVTLESNVKTLHKLLYDDSSYRPSAKVKEISQSIEELAGGERTKTTSDKAEQIEAKTETRRNQETEDETETSVRETKESSTTAQETETASAIGPGIQESPAQQEAESPAPSTAPDVTGPTPAVEVSPAATEETVKEIGPGIE